MSRWKGGTLCLSGKEVLFIPVEEQDSVSQWNGWTLGPRGRAGLCVPVERKDSVFR